MSPRDEATLGEGICCFQLEILDSESRVLMTELVVTTSSACTASAGPSRKLVFPAKVSPRPAFPLGSLLAGLSSCVDNSDRRRLVRYLISPRVCNRAAYCEALA